MSRRSRSVLRVVGFLVGIVATVVGVKWTGVGAIRDALSRAGVNIAWMFAAYAAGTVVGAIPWRALLPHSVRPTWNATITSRFAASGLNALLPFFGLGESVRLLWLRRGERTPGLAALVVDRLLFLAAGLPLLVIAALASSRVPNLPHSYRVGVLVSAAIIGVAVAAVAVGAARGQLVGRLRWALLLFGVPPRIEKTEANGDVKFEDVSPGVYRAAIGAATFRRPFGGVSWLGSKLITPSVIIAYIWVWAGFAMVVIAAGLAAIPRDTLEAARTDGASEWQVFRRVTVPLLAPVLIVVLITMVINVLKVFDIILSVAPESTQGDANVIALAMWRTAFSALDFGVGAAIAVLLFLLVIPILALNIRRFRREV